MISYKRRKISKKQFCYNHSLRKYIQLKVKKIHAIYITSSETASKILQSTWNCARKNFHFSATWLVRCQCKKHFWFGRTASPFKRYNVLQSWAGPLQRSAAPALVGVTLHISVGRLHLSLKSTGKNRKQTERKNSKIHVNVPICVKKLKRIFGVF